MIDIILAIWIFANTSLLLFLYRDFLHFKLTAKSLDQLKSYQSKEVIVPQKGGWFSVKKKRPAVFGDDSRACQYENDHP